MGVTNLHKFQNKEILRTLIVSLGLKTTKRKKKYLTFPEKEKSNANVMPGSKSVQSALITCSSPQNLSVQTQLWIFILLIVSWWHAFWNKALPKLAQKERTMVNCSNSIMEMHPRVILRRENVPHGPEVISRWVKFDWTEFTTDANVRPGLHDAICRLRFCLNCGVISYRFEIRTMTWSEYKRIDQSWNNPSNLEG